MIMLFVIYIIHISFYYISINIINVKKKKILTLQILILKNNLHGNQPLFCFCIVRSIHFLLFQPMILIFYIYSDLYKFPIVVILLLDYNWSIIFFYVMFVGYVIYNDFIMELITLITVYKFCYQVLYENLRNDFEDE